MTRLLILACMVFAFAVPALAMDNAKDMKNMPAASESAYSQQEQQNLDKASDFVAALNDGDIASIKALVASNIVWKVQGSGSAMPIQGEWSGTDHLAQWFQANNGEINLGAPSTFADGQQVVLLGQFSPKTESDNDADDITSAPNEENGEYDQSTPVAWQKCGRPWVAILTFSSGKVSEVKVFDNAADTYWAMSN